MAFKVGKGSTDEMADINVTPLVDVMLVLLIIFMITTPLFQRGIDVSLPRTESSNTKGEERMIVTIVPKKSYVYFNDQAINKQVLESSLKQIYRNRKDKTLYLFADKSVPYGEVMAIMDSIKKSGIDTVGLATEPTHKE